MLLLIVYNIASSCRSAGQATPAVAELEISWWLLWLLVVWLRFVLGLFVWVGLCCVGILFCGDCLWVCLLFDRVNGGVHFMVWFTLGCFRAVPLSRWRADAYIGSCSA